MNKNILIFIIVFLTVIQGFTQEMNNRIPDSLDEKSFDELEFLLRKYYLDSTRCKVYSEILRTKAKKENSPLGLAISYRYLSFNHKDDLYKRLAYLDSSIMVSKRIIHNRYPAVAYSNKASVYKSIGDYEKVLDNYLAALEKSKEVKNLDFYYITMHNIGLLKEETGEIKEAIKIFKEVLEHEENKHVHRKSTDINHKGRLTTMLVLANAYRKNLKLDSASFYNKKGVKESLENDLSIYNSFVLNEGINLFYKKEYEAGLDSIQKAIAFVPEDGTFNKEFLIQGYLHLAKTYHVLNEKELFLKYLFQIDEYYKRDKFVSYGVRNAYEMLVNHYKSIDNQTNQLFYINRLFSVDSTLNKNYKNLSKKIVLEYDTPELLQQKEKIIATLEAEKSTNTTQITVISLFLVLSLGGAGYYYRNQQVYKKRFLQLLDTKNTPVVTPVKKETTKDKVAVTISDETRDHLLTQLQRFEDRHDYLKSRINSKDLAKSFGSNSSYLSIVVNTYKQKSFSQYINDLRIEYVVVRLQTDTKFRKYTIKAIAQEIGFNTAEAFAKKFYKNTGIYPSYFIKQLEAL